jgi:hypothetical protein
MIRSKKKFFFTESFKSEDKIVVVQTQALNGLINGKQELDVAENLLQN